MWRSRTEPAQHSAFNSIKWGGTVVNIIFANAMCGRFTLTQSSDAIATAFEVDAVPAVEPRYNIAPSQPLLAVVWNSERDRREVRHFVWGLIPSWSKDPTIGRRLINARSETVAEKPSFRTAFKRRRCLIVADGFYEWQQLPQSQPSTASPSPKTKAPSKTKNKAKKQPFYFQVHGSPNPTPSEESPTSASSESSLFAFAGLWEHWHGADGSEIESCTILTTAANVLMQPIHHRMPVILTPSQYPLWLEPRPETAQALRELHDVFTPLEASQMTAVPVSPMVNNPRTDHPDCIQAINPSK